MLVTLTVVSGSLPQNSCPTDLATLINLVSYQGTAAEFQNVDTGTTPPGQWQYAPSSDPTNNLYDITDVNNAVSPDFSQYYNVTNAQLTILNSTVAPGVNFPHSTAGVYLFNYANPSCTTAANLIVISKSFTISYFVRVNITKQK